MVNYGAVAMSRPVTPMVVQKWRVRTGALTPHLVNYTAVHAYAQLRMRILMRRRGGFQNPPLFPYA